MVMIRHRCSLVWNTKCGRADLQLPWRPQPLFPGHIGQKASNSIFLFLFMQNHPPVAGGFRYVLFISSNFEELLQILPDVDCLKSPNSNPQMPLKLISDAKRRTHPLVWFAAILCTLLSIAVIIAGIVVFIGYLVIHPRIPSISVIGAHLDNFQNDIAGRLEVQLTIVVRADNDNAKAHASFSDTSFILSFQGIDIAQLVAGSFDVSKNSSHDFYYSVESSSIPLSPTEMEEVDYALKEDLIRFDLKGDSRAQWRVGLLGSVKFWCHLNCPLKFHPSNGTYLNSPCSSRAK